LLGIWGTDRAALFLRPSCMALDCFENLEHELENCLSRSFHILRKLIMAESEDDAAGVPLFEGFSDSATPEPKARAKRKRDVEEKPAAKRRKLKKPKDVDETALDTELGVNQAIGYMDARLLADHIAQRTKRFRPELSLVESEDIHVPGMLGGLGAHVPDPYTDGYHREGNCRYYNLE
jgi:hypothetical protein